MQAASHLRSTVVFDGLCVLCCVSVEWIIRHDPARNWHFVTMQSPRGKRLMWANGLDAIDATSYLVFIDDRVLLQSDGVLAIATSLRSAWRIPAVLARGIPRALRDALYRFVARRRLRWFGARDLCYLPSAEESSRFLDD